MTRTPESFWQHMLEDEPQELDARQGSGFHPLGLGLSITKGDLAALAAQDILFLNHTPIEIAAEIDQGLFAAADGFAIHDPLFRIAGGQPKPFSGEGVDHFGTEDFGQGLVIEQIRLARLL